MAREVVSVESRIEQVTVYEQGARIRRVARVRIEEGSTVRFVGLPLAVIDDTVRTEVDGGVSVSAVRTGLDAGEPARAAPEESPELRAARTREALSAAEVQRLSGALERLRQTPVVTDDDSDEPPAAWGAVLTARRQLLATRTARELALHDQLASARQLLDVARRALEAVAERDRMQGSARDAKLHELRKYVELEPTGSGEATIYLEYQVAAARWAPSYVARLDTETRFELRAVVAQDTGEDWRGVALRLSTAEPDRFEQLPELAAQKIGRRQAEPARKGFRAPPAGADQLYLDYDRAFGEDITTTRPIPVVGYDEDSAAADFAEDETTDVTGIPARAQAKRRAAQARGSAAYAPPPPLAAPAPMLAQAAPAAPRGMMMMGAARMSVMPPGGAPQGEGGAMARREAPPAAPVPRLDYSNLRMGLPASPQRGRLVSSEDRVDRRIAGEVSGHVSTIHDLPLPAGHVANWAHAYDHAFASDGAVDVTSDASWHGVALTSRAGSAKLRHVAVPREQADVFRVATLTNPFDGPLLPGPIDIYDRGQFLVTSEVDYTPPGGKVSIGLGVDPQVKIARNASFHEEAAGMLRGALRLVHAITIEVENLSARPIDLEVRERVPVTREGDDDIEVTLGKIDPAWERWTPDPDAPKDQRLRGGYRWQLVVPAAAKQVLRAGYEVKMAGKLELVGGNRREP